MLYTFDDQQQAKPTSRLAADEPTDEQLMGRIQASDESALTQLYRRHVGLLRTVGARVLGNECDVDDLVQEVFMQVWRQASHYSPENGKALGWVVTLARRRAIDKLRKKQAYQRASDRFRGESLVAEQMPRRSVRTSSTHDHDRSEIFEQVMAALPEAQRDALKLAYYSGMSQREIARHTGQPLGTIKTRLELAMRKFRSAILAMGGVEEWGGC